MKQHKLDDRGVAHFLIPVLVIVVAGIVGAFVVVYKHNNSHSSVLTSSNTAGGNAQDQAKLSTDASKAGSASSSKTSSKKSSTGSSSGSSSSSSSSSSHSGSSSSSSGSSGSKSSTKSTETPLSALEAIITSLKNGGQADVAAQSVTVPGPITDATARPIVFTVNGQTYFAYKQESAADYTASASSIAGSMAIPTADSKPSTVKAHVDSSGNLVDANGKIVGYSTGGD